MNNRFTQSTTAFLCLLTLLGQSQCEETDDDLDGWTVEDGDCNDADADIHPGATEVCDDGVDQDCSGGEASCTFPEGSLSLRQADAKLVGESGSIAATSLSPAGDANADGYDDLWIGAPGYYDLDDVRRGAAYLVHGPVTGQLSLARADAVLIGDGSQSQAGQSVAGGCDINGDGITDVVIGAPNLEYTGARCGGAYVVYGPFDGQRSLAAADALFTDLDYDDLEVGWSVSCAGDINADGYDDVLVGAPGINGGAGAAYLLLGPLQGTFDDTAVDAQLSGENSYDYAGTSVAIVGDVDGDGYDDLLVGAYGADDRGENSGNAYLFYGPVNGSSSLGSADATFQGESEQDTVGTSVSGAGDLDGDGYQDLVIGAEYFTATETYVGAAYVLYGGAERYSGTIRLSEADAKITGEGYAHLMGSAVAGAGDLNGDGMDDLVLGATGFGETTGAAYVVLGPVYGSMSVASVQLRLVGEASGDYAGGAVAPAGDVNGDGIDDVLVGSSANDSLGAAYLLDGVGP